MIEAVEVIAFLRRHGWGTAYNGQQLSRLLSERAGGRAVSWERRLQMLKHSRFTSPYVADKIALAFGRHYSEMQKVQAVSA